MAAPPASLQRRLCHQYLRHGAPASQQLRRSAQPSASVPPSSSPQWPCQQHLSTAPRPSASPSRRPSHQHLRHGALASNISDKAPRPAISQHGAPASNKPHPAEKRTPVWLAIWRIWAGFANSQLLPDAAAGALSRALGAESTAERQLFRTDFRFAPSLPQRSACGPLPFTRDMGVHGLCGRVPDSAGKVYLPDCICPLDCCCSDRCKSVGPSAPIAYATSVSPPEEAVAWPGTQVLDAR